MTRYELHLPISAREAKQRKLPSKIGKLLVEIVDRGDVVKELSEFIHIAQKGSRYMIGQSMTNFLTLKQLKEVMATNKLKYLMDSDINTNIRRPQNVVAECRSRDDIALLLETIRAEGLVFYGETEVTGDANLQEALIEAGNNGYVMSGFLQLYDKIPLFVFYSDSHRSIEALGKLESIRDLFFDYCERNL